LKITKQCLIKDFRRYVTFFVISENWQKLQNEKAKHKIVPM